MSANPSDHSIPQIIKQLSSDFSQLVHSEVALAKSELQENIGKIGAGAGMFGGAGVVGLFAVEFVLLAVMFGLVALGLKAWLSALIVAVVLGAVAAVLALRGKKNMAGASLAPARTIEHVKSDLRVIKDDIDRVRSNQ